MATTPAKRACPECGTLLPEEAEFCPVCALRQAVQTQSDSGMDTSRELRFEHYTVLQNPEGKPFELGRGAMGVTYKAFDVRLQRPAALKIINPKLFGNDSARQRFVREARAAASVRHSNVASVFHIGESGGNYYYAMEFVEGESLQSLIRRSGCLETNLALEIVEQVAAGLAAIEEQHLVHRDIKPSNIMVRLEDGKSKSVKIIDLGLAKGVTEENTLSTVGAFVGTPAYASPEQFAGIATDIRSDLYSLGVTLWEMLSGKVPFNGSAAELMYQHQHAEPPIEKLRNVPAPVIALLQVLLAKDPSERFQKPAQLQSALTRVREAIASGSGLTADELKSVGEPVAARSPRAKPRKQITRWVVGSGLCVAAVAIACFFLSGDLGLFNQRSTGAAPTEKSIAVLPFENISPNKDDAYFADGVQDEILNNLAKIAQLKVISRTSVMQYRPDAKRDLRQIAAALGVANVLEGTVRRAGNHVRVSTELVDARNDNTIWADSYDRDLIDIFAIQREIAQTIAGKLSARLSPTEKQTIEARPTDNVEAYDLYLRGQELVVNAEVAGLQPRESLIDAAAFFEKAARLDPKFTLAYCAIEKAHDALYFWFDSSPEWLAKADQAMNTALQLQPDLSEVRLANARHLYWGCRDYDGARAQLALVRGNLPDDAEANHWEALVDRRQGKFEEAIEKLNQALTRDPRNPVYVYNLADSLFLLRQFRAAGQVYDRAIELQPDHPMLRVEKAMFAGLLKNGDDSGVWSAIRALPATVAGTTPALTWRLWLALVDRDLDQAAQLIEKMKGGEDPYFAYASRAVPVECYSVLLSRLRGEHASIAAAFTSAREQLNLRVIKSPRDASLLSQLAVLDALLNSKETAISEAKLAAEMLPVSRDAVDGPGILKNLAVVYAWTDELDLAFTTLGPLTRMPHGIYYGELKREPYWDPLRKDLRYEKLLAELAPRD